jgi:chromosome segregation ATPase
MQGFEADIVRLTAQLTELRAQYVEADQEREHFRSEMQRYLRRSEVLDAQVRAYTKALEWYASEANWTEQVDDRGRETLRWRWADDDGRMARHALACWRDSERRK